MGRNYDNWGRLVEAVTRREQLRSLSLADSRSPSIRSLDSDYSFSSSARQDSSSFSATPSPLHTQSVKEGRKLSGTDKVVAKTRNAVWKGLSFISGFSSKKDNGREERELQWSKAQRSLLGLPQVKNSDFSTKQNYEVVSQTAEMAKRRAEIARLRELNTLKGHIESIAKLKGIDLGSFHHYYTI